LSRPEKGLFVPIESESTERAQVMIVDPFEHGFGAQS
jgi:hypothetical protein